VPARLSYLTVVSGEGAADALPDTLRSVADAAREGTTVAIASDAANLARVAALLGPTVDGVFNKRVGGVPALCLGFGEGVLRQSDALNELSKAAWEGADVFVTLAAGDTVSPDYPDAVDAAFRDGNGIVGAVVTDRWDGPLRVHEEPMSRGRLLETVWCPPVLAVGRFALKAAGPWDPDAHPGEAYDMAVRLTERFIIAHVPRPLVRCRPRPPLPEADAVAAWRRAVSLANWRADVK
jgi:hypothetical protein